MNALLFAPELVLCAGCLAAFGLTLAQTGFRTARLAALLTAAVFALACFWSLPLEGSLFYGAYRVDLFSQLVKCAMASGFVLILLFGADLKGIPHEVRPEYYFFLLTSLLGLTLLSSSVELLTLFIALELSSYSLYLLVPMRRAAPGQRAQMEASIKYILFGVAASGIMLFGMSYIFGLTGTTYIDRIIPAMRGIAGSYVAMASLLALLAGFLFKLAVFPFHFWAPDVYQGASNDTAAFVSSLPKVAAVAVLVRFCSMAVPGAMPGAAAGILPVGGPAAGHIQAALTALSIASMFYGNLAALAQTDVKRMLGFSGIAHAGYILLGLVALDSWGFATAMFYATAYVFMMLAAFMGLCAVSPDGGNPSVDDLAGLHKRSPWLAFVLAASMFALAGIPPFAGFMGKFMLLASAYKTGHVVLVALAAVNTAIAIYYYLQVVRRIYTVAPASGAPAIALDTGTRLAGAILVALMLALGLAPDTLVQLTASAVRAVM